MTSSVFLTLSVQSHSIVEKAKIRMIIGMDNLNL